MEGCDSFELPPTLAEPTRTAVIFLIKERISLDSIIQVYQITLSE